MSPSMWWNSRCPAHLLGHLLEEPGSRRGELLSPKTYRSKIIAMFNLIPKNYLVFIYTYR